MPNRGQWGAALKPSAGRSAVVIGGTHGMGLATARALLDRGTRVVVTGRDEANVERAQAVLGEQALVIASDSAQVDQIDALGGVVEARLGAVDALFVFAGVSRPERFADVTEESYDHQFAVNAKGAFFTAQRLAPLVADGGAITFTTVAPGPSSAGMSVYAATKAAVRAFAGVMAAELLDRRIRVNVIAPGFVDTPTLGVAGLSSDERETLLELGNRLTPWRRHGSLEEIATAALFLAFDATFTTGFELAVDGGISTITNPA